MCSARAAAAAAAAASQRLRRAVRQSDRQPRPRAPYDTLAFLMAYLEFSAPGGKSNKVQPHFFGGGRIRFESKMLCSGI